ncbi:hypothetical protein E4U61_005541, partial [Claviceps capensis]
MFKGPAQRYSTGLDAGNIDRYEPGGYHPVALGDLGWGSHGTTWAAKDQDSRELRMLRALSGLPKDHPGSSYVNQMLDHLFSLLLALMARCTHNCLVLELVVPNVEAFVDVYYIDRRLHSKLAKLLAKQTLQDLHIGNLAIVVPGLDSLNGEDFIAKLGEFDADAVTKLDDRPWAPN